MLEHRRTTRPADLSTSNPNPSRLAGVRWWMTGRTPTPVAPPWQCPMWQVSGLAARSAGALHTAGWYCRLSLRKQLQKAGLAGGPAGAYMGSTYTHAVLTPPAPAPMHLPQVWPPSTSPPTLAPPHSRWLALSPQPPHPTRWFPPASSREPPTACCTAGWTSSQRCRRPTGRGREAAAAALARLRGRVCAPAPQRCSPRVHHSRHVCWLMNVSFPGPPYSATLPRTRAPH